MAKTLIKWNGRAQGNTYRNATFYVAAYSQAEAARLIMRAGGMESRSGVSEIKNYYHKGSWGTTMNGIEPTEPCVYMKAKYDDTPPVRLI